PGRGRAGVERPRRRAAGADGRSRGRAPGPARAARPPGLRLGVHGHPRAGGRLPAPARTRPRPGAGRRPGDRLRRPGPAPPGAVAARGRAAGGLRMRALILSWEYPPIVEGGLARHVRKLSEQLVAEGVEVHVLTRGGTRSAEDEVRHGVHVHRVAEPEYPADLHAFVAWVRRMNAHMVRA